MAGKQWPLLLPPFPATKFPHPFSLCSQVGVGDGAGLSPHTAELEPGCSLPPLHSCMGPCYATSGPPLDWALPIWPTGNKGWAPLVQGISQVPSTVVSKLFLSIPRKAVVSSQFPPFPVFVAWVLLSSWFVLTYPLPLHTQNDVCFV